MKGVYGVTTDSNKCMYNMACNARETLEERGLTSTAIRGPDCGLSTYARMQSFILATDGQFC